MVRLTVSPSHNSEAKHGAVFITPADSQYILMMQIVSLAARAYL